MTIYTFQFLCFYKFVIKVESLVHKLQKDWQGNSYKILQNNCLSFADAFLEKLGVPKMPSWIRSIADNTRDTESAVQPNEK